MTYVVEGLADSTVRFDDGSSLLVTGPVGAGREAALDVLDDISGSETVVFISTNDGAASAVDWFGERGVDTTVRLGIVDASGSSMPVPEGLPVERLGSPGDLTGMSLGFAKLAQRFEQAGSGDRIRVGLVSVSTLLMYADVQTVFRFLHVFTSRIRSGGLLGVFTLEPGMHDDQTVNTVRAIFDCEARVDEDETVDLRGTGFTKG
ncbi:hypothetical protein N0B31_08865 [Salinirubellus salinus]|uniref:Recombinase RecA n=1 Tax=Salinirubellus salinus TaxID=1364945 RepID=A0A9E7R5Q6_9EURY|nr:hypothetical protein [Salinirubellus salinus]UWM56391.1 hypothetical protein N0B31_08865 [Salinirubellus salinus]